MTEPAEFDRETTPFVTLGGKDWPVPELPWSALKHCRSALLELQDRINAAVRKSKARKNETELARIARQLGVLGEVYKSLSDDDYEAMVMAPIFAGLKVLHPTLKREEMDSWAMGEADRQQAIALIRNQSGLFVFDRARFENGEDDEAGEDKGAP